MCRVVATFSERRSIVAESLPIDRQRGAVSEPFEMIAARKINAVFRRVSAFFIFRHTIGIMLFVKGELVVVYP